MANIWQYLPHESFKSTIYSSAYTVWRCFNQAFVFNQLEERLLFRYKIFVWKIQLFVCVDKRIFKTYLFRDNVLELLRGWRTVWQIVIVFNDINRFFKLIQSEIN